MKHERLFNEVKELYKKADIEAQKIRNDLDSLQRNKLEEFPTIQVTEDLNIISIQLLNKKERKGTFKWGVTSNSSGTKFFNYNGLVQYRPYGHKKNLSDWIQNGLIVGDDFVRLCLEIRGLEDDFRISNDKREFHISRQVDILAIIKGDYSYGQKGTGIIKKIECHKQMSSYKLVVKAMLSKNSLGGEETDWEYPYTILNNNFMKELKKVMKKVRIDIKNYVKRKDKLIQKIYQLYDKYDFSKYLVLAKI